MNAAQSTSPATTPASGLLSGVDLTLARETLADRMTTQLRQQILSGRLSPGDLVPTERELREAFGVSRTTVREALHGLVTSGFLERRSNQLFVRDRSKIPNHEVDYAELAARLSVEDVFETRKALESTAVAAAAKHCTAADISELREILGRMKGGTGPEYHSADIEFHTAIVRMSRNTVLLQVYEGSKYLFFRLPSFWRIFAGHDPGTAKAITGYDGHAPSSTPSPATIPKRRAHQRRTARSSRPRWSGASRQLVDRPDAQGGVPDDRPAASLGSTHVISDPLLAPSRRRTEPDPPPPPRSGRRRMVVALGACGVAAIVAVGASLAAGDDDGDATGASTPATAPIAPTTATPTVTPTTVPSIDAPGTCGGSSTATVRCPTATCRPTSSRRTCH